MSPAAAGAPEPVRRPSTSLRRLNRLLAALGGERYLEVGLHKGMTLRSIEARHRTGVEPQMRPEVAALADAHTTLVAATSDDFFAGLSPEQTFDVVFLDGLHVASQTYRDFCSTLLHTHRRSAILIDDTLPVDVYSSLPDRERSLRFRSAAGKAPPMWHGDVYKVVCAIHDFHPGLDYRTIVGSGNPQTLVWRSAPSASRRPRWDSFEAIDRLTYFDLVDEHDLLQPAPEELAIDACVAALGPPP